PGVVVLETPPHEAREVCGVEPAQVLPAVPDGPAEEAPRQADERLEYAAPGPQHQPDAEQHLAGARHVGTPERLSPALAHVHGEAAPVRRGLVAEPRARVA